MGSATPVLSSIVRSMKPTRLSTRLLQRQSPKHHRSFHRSVPFDVVKPFLLADIGEGITECQLIQWFVQPGARVEQFDKLCEVQSDKASVEITSPFDGVIKRLYYEPDDMAITGKPLVDIDIEGEVSEEDAGKLAAGGDGEKAGETSGLQDVREAGATGEDAPEPGVLAADHIQGRGEERKGSRESSGKVDHSALATPAVRHLSKQHGVDITQIQGTGKDGRVLKEDVHRYMQESNQQEPPQASSATTSSEQDRVVPLTPVQSQMFRTMTRSLNIPHFLYTCATDVTALTALRKKLNASAQNSQQRFTHLPFIIKAVSLAFKHHPLLNAALNTSDPKKPQLTYKGSHNFGIAIDTPAGLLVPVVRGVDTLSVAEIAQKLRTLSEKARNSKLAPSDFSGASFTLSNIGNVGGGVVAPVISEPQVAILGIGRSKVVPAFNEHDELVKREELVLSWSADHRVVDGAECARCAERVRALLEDPERMLVEMK